MQLNATTASSLQVFCFQDCDVHHTFRANTSIFAIEMPELLCLVATGVRYQDRYTAPFNQTNLAPK